jgi:hypothetical protein
MWATLYQWPKIPKNFIFGNFLHGNSAIGLCHSYILCTIVPKVFMVRILGQKHCLDIPYESLNFIFLGDKIF